MFGPALIIFRESIEAALVICIVAAATRGVQYRTLWIGFGLIAGIIGSVIIAGLTEVIASMADGSGQELFNASILGIAVIMLAWHQIWMSSHGTELARDAKELGSSIRNGSRELSAVAILVMLTVLREGAESVLFLHGMATSGDSIVNIIAGGTMGLAGGITFGVTLYLGLMRIPMRLFFSVTGTLLILLAAGLAGQMARFLIQADILPPLATPLWDTSALLPTTSALGSTLHVLVGYESNPSGMQILFYGATISSILFFTALVKKHHQKSPTKNI